MFGMKFESVSEKLTNFEVSHHWPLEIKSFCPPGARQIQPSTIKGRINGNELRSLRSKYLAFIFAVGSKAKKTHRGSRK